MLHIISYNRVHFTELCEISKGYSIFILNAKKNISIYLSIHRLYLQEDIDPLVQATKLELYANNLENEGT